MGIIKDGTVSGVLPKAEVFAVHYPGYPSSTSRAIETLGGLEGINKVRCSQSNDSNRLELRFRPEDPYSHPAFGECRSSSNLLLKISKVKCSVNQDTKMSRGISVCSSAVMTSSATVLSCPESGTKGQQRSLTENEMTFNNEGSEVQQYPPPNLSADIVARVSEVYHFSGMVDYQHVLAVHADVAGRKKRHWKELEPRFEKGGLMDLDQEDLMILVPPLFSLKDVPEKLVLRPPATLSLKKKQDGVVQHRWEMDIEPCIAVDFGIKDILLVSVDVPKKFHWEEFIKQGDGQWQWQMAVAKLFDERPIWHRHSLTQRLHDEGLEFSDHLLKRLLFRTAYYFSTGPFRLFWIRKGYDPRRDPESRKYQKIDFRVPPPLRNFGDANTTDAELKARWKDLCAFTVFPSKNQACFQLCDLADDYIQEVIRKPSDLRTCLCWEMAPRAIDVGWMYCTKINNNRLQTKCNFCDACHYGGGVTRHKQHLAGGYANVQKCTKCPLEISRKMQEHLARSRAKGNQREDDDERLTEELMEDIDEYRGSDVGPDDEDAEMVAAMRASREEARAHEWEMRHGMRRSQSYRPGEGSGLATPSSRRKEKSERVEAFCRSASVKEMFEMFKDSGKGKMKNTDKGKKKKSPDIRDMADPAAYRPRDASQRRIEESLKSHSLKARMGRAISRWFHSALIPAHKAKDPHFKAMVREIQRCGPNVTPPTPYEISGTYLDEVVVEVKEYIERFKEKWPEYGVTIMCDGWSGPTRLSIINFLVFCDGRTIFHKSVNASAEIKDAAYLYRLMDEVVEEIGEENVVQIVTDNAANFKKAGLSLMQKRQHIYWTPCAAHCIDLIFKDIGEIKKIQDLVSDARRITNFIYNHTWVLALMRSHTLGDLVRPASTRFATNYVALSSLLERMDGLVQMFTSQEWFCSTYASSEPGRYVQDLVTSTRFWAKIRRVNGLMQPLFSILREVDGDKDQTMGILMDRMLRAMLTIVQLNTSESQKVAKIIDSRLGGMLLQDIHRAASYLNPTLQYQDARLGYDVKMLDALRRVINRMEPDTIRAAAAVDEIKIFREGSQGFADRLAIHSRDKTKPGWFSSYVLDSLRLRVQVRFLSVYPKASPKGLLKSASERFEKLKKMQLYKTDSRPDEQDHQHIDGDSNSHARGESPVKFNHTERVFNDDKNEQDHEDYFDDDDDDEIEDEAEEEEFDELELPPVAGEDGDFTRQPFSYAKNYLQELFGSFPSAAAGRLDVDTSDGEYQIYEQDSSDEDNLF